MDTLLQLAQNPVAHRMWTTLRIPFKLPQPLRRADGPWCDRPLAGREGVVSLATGKMTSVLADTILSAGATVHVLSGSRGLKPWTALAPQGAVYVLSDSNAPAAATMLRPDFVVLDATDVKSVAELDRLYDTFHPWVGRIAPNGRCAVVGKQPKGASSPSAHAAFRAMDGFVRSLAKEVGRKGITAHFVSTPSGGEAMATPLLRFLLSDHSSFVTGQPWHLSALCAPPKVVPRTRLVQDKVALVTGAARGIGEATARTLAREGARVVCLDRPSEMALLEQLAQDIDGEVLAVDISEPSAPQQIADHFTQVHSAVDIVIHNAGVTRDRTLAKMGEEPWRTALDINLAAVLRINDSLAPRLAYDGRMVVVSSIAGMAGNIGQANYSASKAGLLGYVDAMSKNLASKRVSVVAMAPGFIETRMTRGIPLAVRETGRRLSALNQGGLPIDVAEMATFLASPGAYGFSGQAIRVCGGMMLGA